MINAATRLASRPFYASAIHGECGFIFADLVDHQFVIDRDASNKAPVIGPETTTRSIVHVQTRREPNGAAKEAITKREMFCPLILANSSSLEQTITSSARRLRAVPALLPALRALFDFQRTCGKFPDPKSSIDLGSFTSAANSHAQQLLLPSETLTADFLRSFIQSLGAELPTTASFVGSRLGEDVINVITHREQPVQNLALFDGDSGPIYCLYSRPPDLSMAMAPLAPNGVYDVVGAGVEVRDLGNGAETELEVANGDGAEGLLLTK